jgi:hypothetical protein
VQPRGGAGKTALLGHGQKGFELAEFHGQIRQKVDLSENLQRTAMDISDFRTVGGW